MKLAQFINETLIALANLLEREAGYHLVSLALIALGVALIDNSTRPQVAHDLVVFGTGVLARSMGARKGQGGPTA